MSMQIRVFTVCKYACLLYANLDTHLNWLGVVMLTEQIKSLIENECALSPRLTGVFFRKHLNQSMYGNNGQLTEFAIQCHHYFNELKRAAEQRAFHVRLEQCRLQHEQQQESVKRVNQSVKKSANQSRAQFIGSLRFELNQGVLMVRSVSRSMPTPTKWIRRYLKKLGVRCLVSLCLTVFYLLVTLSLKSLLVCKLNRLRTTPYRLN